MATVGGGVLRPWVKAAVAAARQPREFGILLAEEVDHRAYRRAEIVKVEAVETASALIATALVVAPQPADELVDLAVAPHPDREALERPHLSFAFRSMTDIAVDRRAVGPVALDRDDIEPVAFDQLARDGRSGAIEFARPMARLAEQDDARIAKAAEEFTKRAVVDVGQRLGRVRDQSRQSFQFSEHSSILPRRSVGRNGRRPDSPA